VSPSTPILIAASAVAIGIITYLSLSFSRQIRLRRHLRRLRTVPLEQGGK
jgi:uncharacterized integral membrane protein